MSICDYLELLPNYLSRNPSRREAVLQSIENRILKDARSESQVEEIRVRLQNPPRTYTAQEMERLETVLQRVSQQPQQRCRGRVQDYSNFPSYITPSVWRGIEAAQSDVEIAQVVAKHLCKLGLRTVSEKTSYAMLCFTLCASRAAHDKDQEEELRKMHDCMKNLLRQTINKWQKKMDITCWRLPAEWSDFDGTQWKEACGDETPMRPLPVSADAMSLYALRFDVRPRQKDKATPLCEPSDTAKAIAMAADVAKEALAVVVRKHHSPDTVKIKMLTSPSQRGTTSGLLAIEDAPRKPTVPLQVDRKDAMNSSFAPINLLERFDKDSSKEANEKKEDANNMHDQSPGLILQEAQSLQGKLLTSPRHGGKSGVSPLKRPSAKQGMEGGTTDQLPSATYMKRPAACKRPASSQSPAVAKRPAMPGSKPVTDIRDEQGRLLMSAAERLRRHPSGCGKCRGRKGCTESCLRGRKEI